MRTPITTKTTTRFLKTRDNLCFPSPCVRGTCYIDSDNDQSIFCLCPSGFTGRHCEMVPTIPANPCSPSPCVRGSCYIGSGNIPTFFCMCPTGFTGLHCEIVLTTPANTCFPSPCVRGSCYIGGGNIPTFFCSCPTGFTGLLCETVLTTPANPCSASPCVRGSCFIGGGNNATFFCLCPTGFTGLHCETDIATTSSPTTHPTPTTMITCPPHPRRTASRYRVFDRSCYEFVSTHKSWSAAEVDCRSQGGYLVIIDNGKEQDMVHRVDTSLLKNDSWIGLNDINYEGHFAWVSGIRSTFANFGITHSHILHDCVIMRRHDGKWDERHCNWQFPYVCEYAGHNNPVVSLIG
ncbi:neurogenic locus notch homolog protein 3-like isoform X3 [Dreissena polymorpha]|uniref:neurogenic locus notch homolog protein 3-like isoform X3 n=1 Tax=Dreissena polymorpha TaxID=45954 RepID=UPI0022640FE2|nr:neurogenic locus notch homolog protein 3-like isoform X3 [Dreissena polymorpha]